MKFRKFLFFTAFFALHFVSGLLDFLSSLSVAVKHVSSEVVLVLSDWLNMDSVELEAADIFNHAGTNNFLGAGFYHCKDEDKAFQHGVKVGKTILILNINNLKTIVLHVIYYYYYFNNFII